MGCAGGWKLAPDAPKLPEGPALLELCRKPWFCWGICWPKLWLGPGWAEKLDCRFDALDWGSSANTPVATDGLEAFWVLLFEAFWVLLFKPCDVLESFARPWNKFGAAFVALWAACTCKASLIIKKQTFLIKIYLKARILTWLNACLDFTANASFLALYLLSTMTTLQVNLSSSDVVFHSTR